MRNKNYKIDDLNSKISNSIKWTSITEVFSKLAVPIMNMILARLISSQIFGIVASVQVVVSFAEIISEGGYAKFILQKKFSSGNERRSSVGTGLLTSIFLGVLLFLIIFIFRNPFATLVGAAGYGWVLVLSASQLPFYAVVNILASICKRDFKFNVLTYVKVISVLTQLLTSVCFALYGLEIWAIPIASLSSILIQLVVLSLFLRKEICFRFSVKSFKEMWGTSSGFFIAAFLTWVCTSINTLFASRFLGQSEAGVLKNAASTISGIISLLNAVYSPVLISYLAKLNVGDPSYTRTFYKFQKIASSIFVPLGVGMFVYGQFLSDIFFGPGWDGASIVIGCMGLMNCLKICTSDFVATLYNAQGKPWWIILSDGIYSVVQILIWVVFRNKSFEFLIVLLSVSSLVPTALNLSLSKKNTGVSSLPILRGVASVLIPSFLMGLIGYFLKEIYNNFYIDFFYIFVCITVYFSILFSLSDSYLKDYFSLLKNKHLTIKTKEKFNVFCRN